MKKLFIALLFLMVTCSSPVPSWAAFVVCDSYTTGTIPNYFKVSLDGAAEVQSPAWSGTGGGQTYTNSLHFDVSGVTVGTHSMTIRACKAADPVWNVPEACSTTTPFTFTRPAAGGTAPANATGIHIIP